MAGEAERLLSAEKAVAELLDNLELLKMETEGYSQAKSTLEGAGKHIGEVATSLKGLLEQARSVIQELGKVGTPELLSQIEALRTAQSDLVQAVHGNLGDVIERVHAVNESSKQVIQALGEVTATTNAFQETTGRMVGDIGGQMRAEVERSQTELRNLVSASDKMHQDGLNDCVVKLGNQLSAMQTRLGRRLGLVLTFVIFGFILSLGAAAFAVLYTQGLLHR